MPQNKKANPKNHISTSGSLEVQCAYRISTKLDALESFVMDLQSDIASHIKLSPKDYDRMIKMSDEEIAENGKPELDIINRLQYVMGNFGTAQDMLHKIMDEDDASPKEMDSEANKSYR